MGDMFLALRKYADFSGRASRREYWMFQLLNMIVSFGLRYVLVIGDLLPMQDDSPGLFVSILAGLGGLVSLALFIPSLAVSVRRLHDIGKSGKLLFLNLIPFVLVIPSIVFFFMLTDKPTPSLVPIGIAVIGICVLSFLALSIMFLVFHCTPGTIGPNRYGPDPYEEETPTPIA
jgi:uncharacterized membrane protein YhaH (DUF805 family)